MKNRRYTLREIGVIMRLYPELQWTKAEIGWNGSADRWLYFRCADGDNVWFKLQPRSVAAVYRRLDAVAAALREPSDDQSRAYHRGGENAP